MPVIQMFHQCILNTAFNSLNLLVLQLIVDFQHNIFSLYQRCMCFQSNSYCRFKCMRPDISIQSRNDLFTAESLPRFDLHDLFPDRLRFRNVIALGCLGESFL